MTKTASQAVKTEPFAENEVESEEFKGLVFVKMSRSGNIYEAVDSQGNRKEIIFCKECKERFETPKMCYDHYLKRHKKDKDF